MKIYAVGGAVRDRLLGRPIGDRDWVVVGAHEADLEAAGYRRVGKDFPVFLHPDTHEEYALARRERKTAPGYAGFSFDAAPSVTLEEDLLRRDLTVNAMAEAEDGSIIDPYGGRRDLELRVLRHVSPAFAEDPVRILRVARFAARFDWPIADETRTLMRAMVASGEVDALVPERVWAEWQRALEEPHPTRFITTLADCGALERLWPEFAVSFREALPTETANAPQSVPEASDAVAASWGERGLQALAAATALGYSGVERFAATLQVIARAGRAADLERLFKRMRAPVEYAELGRLVGAHIELVLSFDTRQASQTLDLLQGLDALRRSDRFLAFTRVLRACAKAEGRLQVIEPKLAWATEALDVIRTVTSEPLIAAGYRGPALGEALRAAREAAIASLL